MRTKLCLAAVLLVPAFALAECLVEAESERQLELLETAERAWVEYRNATCELIAERDNDELRAEAMATCLAFYAREREFELQLMSRVLTFTNVRSILEAE
jgi:uncharacterized protein YecT (DUF1311 family)